MLTSQIDQDQEQLAHEVSDPVAGKPAKVILVHGTFASSNDDRGQAWWQVGSSAYENLQKQLPADVSLAKEGEVFRWSGENNERARSKAAAKLLDHIRPLEEAGRPYHLVGHSHGGSVIWVALVLATARKQPLQHLQSWSTIGTPFLRHQTRSPWNVISVVYMVLAASLLIPAGRAFWALAAMPYRLAMGQMNEGMVIKNDQEAGVIVSVVRAPILKLMEICGVTFVEVPKGIRMGSFDPQSGDSFAEFLLFSIEGWMILAGILLFGYLTLLLGSWCITPVMASLRIRYEDMAERQALQRFAPRWLGLWTTDDEAINGLRATLDLSISFVGRLAPRERVYFSDSIGLLSRPYLWLLAPIYNSFFRPSLDTLIRGIVVRTAQGNNRPAAEVVDVSPCPLIPPQGPDVPPLPPRLQKKILDGANRYAKDLGPKLRDLIAQPSFVSGLEQFGKELSGKELVHTSYFDHPEVLNLLAMNILWARNQSITVPAEYSSHELLRWFQDYKDRLLEFAGKTEPIPRFEELPTIPYVDKRHGNAA